MQDAVGARLAYTGGSTLHWTGTPDHPSGPAHWGMAGVMGGSSGGPHGDQAEVRRCSADPVSAQSAGHS